MTIWEEIFYFTSFYHLDCEKFPNNNHDRETAIHKKIKTNMKKSELSGLKEKANWNQIKIKMHQLSCADVSKLLKSW